MGGVGWRRVVCCLLFVGVCWLCVWWCWCWCVCVCVLCVCVCVSGVLVVCVDFPCYSLSHRRKMSVLQDVLEYVLDVSAYLHRIFLNLFEDRKVSITRVQRPRIAAQLGEWFGSLTCAAHRWSHREQGASKLSSIQATLRSLAAEACAADNGSQACRCTCHRLNSCCVGSTVLDSSRTSTFSVCFCLCDEAWLLLAERFPVVADFHVENPARWAHEFSLNIASLLGDAKVDGLVAEKLEAALQKLQSQVSAQWSSLKSITVPLSTKPARTKT